MREWHPQGVPLHDSRAGNLGAATKAVVNVVAAALVAARTAANIAEVASVAATIASNPDGAYKLRSMFV
jgi:hypothetical protein